ncbi:MAG: outer membrane beta-barrel family protein [Saprospiraceae bacterium]|nr:outer membrane beta-barrel family protein [Saprospiraceae bacterium]
MKKAVAIFMLAANCITVFAQQQTTLLQGTASYVSSQNVYVKFASTEDIAKGDTLFAQKDSLLTPCLVVKDKSSSSCVCSSLLSEKVQVNAVFFARVATKSPLPQPIKEVKNETPNASQDSLPSVSPTAILTPETEEKPAPGFKQKIKGRLSAASYSSSFGDETTHRMRYAFTLQGDHLGNSRFSTDNYITFRHTVGEWQAVKDNLGDALKIFSLSVKYDLDKTSSISLGRKINQRISSMGAIDGLQVEKGFGNFMVGGIAGSRPNFQDYGLDFGLLQVGAYVGHASQKAAKQQQTTLAFVEQRNGRMTDRRFMYFQHSNTLLRDLSFFGSAEIDLYENLNGEAKNTLNLTNMLLTLRYKLSKKTSASLSYDNRRNILYYESYKSYIEQLIDNETRQGLRFNLNYRPFKWVSWGANVNWRFQKSDLNLSKNLNSYLNFSRIPIIGATASLTANLLQTPYLDSKMYGLRLTKEIVPGKLNTEAYFRMVDYRYSYSELRIHQNVAGLDLSLNLTRKLALYLYYEGTFDKKSDTFHRVNAKIIQRF